MNRSCPRCEAAVGDDSFCRSCGQDLRGEHATPESAKPAEHAARQHSLGWTVGNWVYGHKGASLASSVGLIVVIVLVIVLVGSSSGGGASLNPTRVQVTLQQGQYGGSSTDSSGDSITFNWSCNRNIGGAGDSTSADPVNCSVTETYNSGLFAGHQAGGQPQYGVAPSGASCFTASTITAEDQTLAQSFGFPNSINECF